MAKDRRDWLDGLLETGDWASVRKLRKGFTPKQGRLRNAEGDLVESNLRADVLADHLEKVQWAPRPIAASTAQQASNENLFGPLPVKLGKVEEAEVCKAAGKLKNDRASGLDRVPGEFWKAVSTPRSPAVRWVVRFCNLVWEGKCVPDSWREARVAMLFKKGDPALASNYRPISLLAVSYKMFAAILLDRLREAGAESRIWHSQFGFKRGSGTRDALFAARRLIEKAWEEKHGKLTFLALDWARAFDSLDPAALQVALKRFGCPAPFIEMIRAIYDSRSFVVADGGVTSGRHTQHNGISQGCPLSPFLFIMVMTVLLHDAKQAMGPQILQVPMSELVYADDTLLLGTSEVFLQRLMECIGQVGGR